jgi:predicted metalloprotease
MFKKLHFITLKNKIKRLKNNNLTLNQFATQPKIYLFINIYIFHSNGRRQELERLLQKTSHEHVSGKTLAVADIPGDIPTPSKQMLF